MRVSEIEYNDTTKDYFIIVMTKHLHNLKIVRDMIDR